MLEKGSLLKGVTLFALFLIASHTTSSGVFAAEQNEIPKRFLGLSPNKYTPEDVDKITPPSPNPWLSMVPSGQKVDWNYWNMRRRVASRARASLLQAPSSTIIQSRGSWLPFTLLPTFGTRRWQNNSIEIIGEYDLPEPVVLEPFVEDEGSIPLASETPGLESGGAVAFSSVIGDGDFGSQGTGSGDLDFYVIRDVVAGEVITVDIDTQLPFDDLDSFVELLNSEGEVVAFNDDDPDGLSFDSFITFTVPEGGGGDYYVSVSAFGTFTLLDPFDSSSGLGNIFGLPLSEGEYILTIGLDYSEERDFIFLLRRGDVFGASIDGVATRLTLVDRTKTERQGSASDFSFIFPEVSPLPGGLISVNHVADNFGLYKLTAFSVKPGAFTLRLEAALPTLRIAKRKATQTIFVDFDGATVDLSESVSPEQPPGTLTSLSPLSVFLPGWGLSDADEDELIDKIMWVTKESLVRDISRNGGNRNFKIRLLNSRDHDDPFGEENASRVIVGGTIDELGIPTIGIAQSIDVGNFDTSETAFVLLDLLSDPNPLNPDSLNTFPIDPRSSIIDLVGVAVGELVAHEAGHYLGNWHTDQFNETPNIMDQGGNIGRSIIGIGADGIFGTTDDVNVGFGRDVYVPSEGYTGIENTLTSIAWGATRRSFFFSYDEVAKINVDDDGVKNLTVHKHLISQDGE